MAVKVFQIGFHKCGTRTIFQFFRRQGIPSVHWDSGRLAQALYNNLGNGNDILQGYENYHVFTDMEFATWDFVLEGFKLFPYMARDYPDALFILNTRDREDWLRSRFGHKDGLYIKKRKRALAIDDDDALKDIMRADWDHHHERAIDFFKGKAHRFVKFDIAKDSPQLLVDALPEYKLDAAHYVHVGRTKPKGEHGDRAPDDDASIAGSDDDPAEEADGTEGSGRRRRRRRLAVAG